MPGRKSTEGELKTRGGRLLRRADFNRTGQAGQGMNVQQPLWFRLGRKRAFEGSLVSADKNAHISH